MKRIVLLVAAILAAVLVINGQPQREPSTRQQDHSQGKKTPLQPPLTGPPVQPITVVEINQEAPQKDCNGAESHAKCYLKHLFSPENLPNTSLAIAGIVGIIVALLTLGAIKRQGNLQEAAMRQWVIVEISEVKSYGSIPDISNKSGQRAGISINFKVVNDTPFKIALKRIFIEIHYGEKPNRVFGIKLARFLPPGKVGKESSYPFVVPLELKEPAMRKYLAGGFIFSFKGTVSFESATGRWEDQDFANSAVCGPGKIELSPWITVLPEKGNG
jgi:hypothetical protein